MVVPVLILAVRVLATPAAYRALTVTVPAFLAGPGLANAVRRFEQRAQDEDTDAALTAAVAGPEGYPVLVTTYAEPFELRKMQVQFTHADVATTSDDVRVMTFHLAKITTGAVDSTWDSGDFTDAVAAFDAFWGSIKENFAAAIVYDRVKFYKAGPAIAPPQPPAYDADKNVPGTGAQDSGVPQVAISVTEMAGTKPHWGRFYLPPPMNNQSNLYARIHTALQTDIADAADVMYTAWQTAGIPAVVYRAPLPVRTKKNGTELPARAGSAWTVDSIQVDDVFDVIRSRRRKYPTLRLQRAIG